MGLLQAGKRDETVAEKAPKVSHGSRANLEQVVKAARRHVALLDFIHILHGFAKALENVRGDPIERHGDVGEQGESRALGIHARPEALDITLALQSVEAKLAR